MSTIFQNRKRSPPVFFHALLCMCVCVLSSGVSFAQDGQRNRPEELSRTALKVEVRRVILDVVVTGQEGRAVRGIGRERFLLAEDGKKQTVLTLEEHDLDGPLGSTPAKPPCVPPGTFVNVPAAPERGPLYVLLYDIANMEREDQPVARQQLLRFVEAKEPGTRFALVVLSNGAHLAQGFTEDKSVLLAAVKDQVPPFFLQAANYGRGNPSVAISTFTKIANLLEGISGRKNVIWFSGQFPLVLSPSATNASIGAIYSEAQRKIVNTLARDEIAIYPVDVRGLSTDAQYVSGTGQGPNAHSGSERRADVDPKTGLLRMPPPPNEAQTIAPTYSALGDSYLTENEIAKETGGQAFHGRNDLAGALQEAVRTGGTYYTLTYSPSNRAYDGKARQMHVEVSGASYRPAYRRDYVADRPRAVQVPVNESAGEGTPPGTVPSGSLSEDLRVSMRHGAPLAHGLLFVAEVHALGEPAPATPGQMAELAEANPVYSKGNGPEAPKKHKTIRVRTFAVQFKLSEAEIQRGGSTGEDVGRLVFATAAYDRNGTLLSSVTQSTLAASLSRSAGLTPISGAEQRIQVPVTAEWLRVGVEDTASFRTGSLEVALPIAATPTCGAQH